jgi:hypothetical protein
MSSNSYKTVKRIWLLWTLLVSCGPIVAITPVTFAQEPIRVQTNQVLVPVFVLDEERLRGLTKDHADLFRAIFAGDTQRVDAITEGVVIRDLTVADFQIQEDGKAQAIQNVTYEQSLFWNVHDNLGHHTEYIGPGGGKWSTVEWPPGLAAAIKPPHYLIAYAQPESPKGSCHQITVKVNRPNVRVSARSEYCNSDHSASDPLNGTSLSKQMESDIAVPKDNSVNISLQAIALPPKSDVARVHIAIDWRWKSLKGRIGRMGVLGMVFKKDGSPVMRFSDLADKVGASHRGSPESSGFLSNRIDLTENRYETQVSLPPGEYDLRVALGDGTRFGRAESPLTVDSYDLNELAISAVSLCKQISDASPNSHKLPGAWTATQPQSYVPLVSKDREFKPTGDTLFKASETLNVYFEVYEPWHEGEPQGTVDVQIRIVESKTGTLLNDPRPMSATPYWKAGSTIIPIGRGFDISKVPRGSYRLDVRASDSKGRSTDWRSVNFSVE